ncbi:PTS sugar transporter subunit IIC [Mycoplasmopsis columboralis]|uniref:PTS system oligo-beta-mannoside-specific EIIC component n=1 Tax=Mycoplasmopsis columboralis TaxID=171282 RepID=A0A449B5U9_9BACT|nr:PTS transporter subunit EIIC [Mycoplasmopsis columboralis]VEU75977.1 PTS system oligo-beta-mannoside-specific EIIC component [Mycoplasmopsis columboralis]
MKKLLNKKSKNDQTLFKKFFNGFERMAVPIMGKLAENRYINAIKTGMVSILPILLIGSLILVIWSFPINAKDGLYVLILKTEASKKFGYFLMLPYRATYPMMGFFAVIGITRALAKSYKMDEQQSIFASIIVYLISIVGPMHKTVGHFQISTAALGSATVFGGIIISFAVVEIIRLFHKYKIIIRLPKSVPEVVAKPFNALIPMIFTMFLASLIFQVAAFDIHSYAKFVLSPLQSLVAGNNYGGFLIVVLLIMFLWFAGIHGVSIIGALARPFWTIALDNNSAQKIAESKLLLYAKDNGAIFVEPFFQWFVWIGGAGATVGLLIAMLVVARSKYLRSITYPSLVPGIFNINEPVIFGYPLVLNPYLFIPSILAPVAMGTLTFIAMKLNIVALPTNLVGWTLPAPIGAYLATLDWKAPILAIINIVLSVLIWAPFAKAYDKKLFNDEIDQEVALRANDLEDKSEESLANLRKEVEKEFNSRGLLSRLRAKKAA